MKFTPAVALFAIMNLGCASYTGTARQAQIVNIQADKRWVVVPNFPRVLQAKDHDCGAAALAAVLGYWGKPTTPEAVSQSVGRNGKQLRASDIETYARSSGFSSYVFYGNMGDILYELQRGRPVIVGVGKPYGKDKAVAHYQVVIGYEPHKKRVLFLDPAIGFQTNTYEGFAREWAVSKGVTIVTFLSAAKTAQAK